MGESPGAYHGIAESHIWLSDRERLAIALKACDLYLELVSEYETAFTALEVAAGPDTPLGRLVTAAAERVQEWKNQGNA